MKATVRRVCMDRWEGYAGAVTAVLPHAQIVVDRFHVAVQYRKAVDELRKQECRRINADQPADQALSIAELRRVLHLEWPSLNLALLQRINVDLQFLTHHSFFLTQGGLKIRTVARRAMLEEFPPIL
jgi:Transposase